VLARAGAYSGDHRLAATDWSSMYQALIFGTEEPE